MEPYRSKNQHPHDVEILKKLGIIERSTGSFSDDDENAKRAIRRPQRMSESEEEVLFEKDSFLKRVEGPGTLNMARNGFFHPYNSQQNVQGRVGSIFRRNKSMNVISWHLFLCHAAFFTFGLCVSIIGPSLLSVRFRSLGDSPVHLVCIVTFSALGIFLGVTFGEITSRRFNVFCLLTFSSLLCAVFTYIVHWSDFVFSIILIFTLQGFSLGMLQRGAHHIFYTCWRQNHRVYVLLYFSMALGCVVSPMFASTFLSDAGPSYDVSSTLSKQSVSYILNPVTHLINKREAVENFTIFANRTGDSNLLNVSTLVKDRAQNFTDVTSLVTTKNASLIIKVKKPLINDGTNVEPPHLRADDKKSIKKTTAPPTFIVQSQLTSSAKHTTSKFRPDSSNFTSPPLFNANISSNLLSLMISTKKVTTQAPSVDNSSLSGSNGTTRKTAVGNFHRNKSPMNPAVSLRNHVTVDQSRKLNAENRSISSSPLVSFSASLKPTVRKIDQSAKSSSTQNSVDVQSSPTNFVPPLFNSDDYRSNVMSTTPPRNDSSSVIGRLWSTVLDGRGLAENLATDTDYVYVLISICSFFLFVLFAVTCCCFASTFGILRGKFVRHMSAPVDCKPELTFDHVWSSKLTFFGSIFVAGCFCWLCAGFESLMANDLVFYFSRDQRNAGFLSTVTFWCGVCLSRLVCAAWYKLLWRTNYVLASCVLCAATLGSILAFADAQSSPRLLCVAFLCVGLCTGFLSPGIFCWFSDYLSPGPWFHTFWLLVEQMGRATVPQVAAFFFNNCGGHACLQSSVPILALILVVFSCVSTVFGRVIVVKDCSANGVADPDGDILTRRVKGPDGQVLEYRRQLDEQLDEDIECFGVETD